MRKRFPFPAMVEGLVPEWKRFLNLLFYDLYPNLQPFTPVPVGVTDGNDPVEFVVTSGLVRMGRLWNVNITFEGDSVSSNGYLELPFTSYANTLFMVKMDTDTTPLVAYIEKNTTRLYLPDWNSTTRVMISGTAGE